MLVLKMVFFGRRSKRSFHKSSRQSLVAATAVLLLLASGENGGELNFRVYYWAEFQHIVDPVR